METGANIVRRYAKSEPVERIDIICAHYENFTSIIDSFEVGVFHLISSEKANNRQKRKGDLGVRIQDGKGLNPQLFQLVSDSVKEGKLLVMFHSVGFFIFDTIVSLTVGAVSLYCRR